MADLEQAKRVHEAQLYDNDRWFLKDAENDIQKINLLDYLDGRNNSIKRELDKVDGQPEGHAESSWRQALQRVERKNTAVLAAARGHHDHEVTMRYVELRSH